MNTTLTITGSGTSHGIPVIGCRCPVCRSTDPKDKRLRTSAIIEADDGSTVAIDTGPEFRIQALRYGLKRLDAVLLTHPHADHVHGLDDVRIFSISKPISVYADTGTITDLYNRFDYVFKSTQLGGGKPQINLINAEPFTPRNPLHIGSIEYIVPIPLIHGTLRTTGWRIKNAAYLTDTNLIPHESMQLISGIQYLIIDALRMRPHCTHFNFEQALQCASQTDAHYIYFTHICHDFSHNQIMEIIAQEREKYPGLAGRIIEPAFDGLILQL